MPRSATDHNSGEPGPVILIADDSEADRFFLLRAFRESGVKNRVHVIGSGADLISYLAGDGKYSDRIAYPMPGIVFLDLQMPPPNGFDVLHWKQQNKKLPKILWVAMSGVYTVRTINDAYSAGANTFLMKPLEAVDIRNLIEAFEDYWQSNNRNRK